MDIIIERLLQILIPVLTFVLGILSTALYNRKKEKSHANKDFYIPIIKYIATQNLIYLNTEYSAVLHKDTIDELINFSFDNLQHMESLTQGKFVSLCTLWLAFQQNNSIDSQKNFLAALRDYLISVLNDASHNAKKINKELPTTVATWVTTYM